MTDPAPKLPDDDGTDGDAEESSTDSGERTLTPAWTDDRDEHRRAFIVEKMADPNIQGDVLVKNMHAVCEWLRTGELPKDKTRITKASG